MKDFLLNCGHDFDLKKTSNKQCKNFHCILQYSCLRQQKPMSAKHHQHIGSGVLENMTALPSLQVRNLNMCQDPLVAIFGEDGHPPSLMGNPLYSLGI